MKHIDVSSKDGRFIKVSDDETYQDIGIYCGNVDQENEFVIKLISELLKGK